MTGSSIFTFQYPLLKIYTFSEGFGVVFGWLSVGFEWEINYDTKSINYLKISLADRFITPFLISIDMIGSQHVRGFLGFF